MSGLLVQVVGGAVRFAVRVQPRASQTEIVGLSGTALKVRVQAPPVDGAANEAVVDLLAKRLRIPRCDVRVVSGASGRSKVVEATGVVVRDVEALAEREEGSK